MANAEAKARRAALTVHALPEADQTRLLDMLDAIQRERVVPLLAELKALGIPPSALPSMPATDAPALGIERLALLDPAAAADQLARTSPEVAAAILHLAPKAWAHAVTKGLPEVARGAISVESLRVQKPGPKASEALYEAVVDALGADGTSAAAIGRGGRWQRMLRWIR